MCLILLQWGHTLTEKCVGNLVTHFHELDHPSVIDKADTCQEGSEGEGTADILMILGRVGKVKRAPILGLYKRKFNITKTKSSLSSRAEV